MKEQIDPTFDNLNINLISQVQNKNTPHEKDYYPNDYNLSKS